MSDAHDETHSHCERNKTPLQTCHLSLSYPLSPTNSALCINLAHRHLLTERVRRMSYAHDEIPSHCERQKRSFANMSSFAILPPSPPQSMLWTIASQDIDEKQQQKAFRRSNYCGERFLRLQRTALVQMWRVCARVCAHSRIVVATQ